MAVHRMEMFQWLTEPHVKTKAYLTGEILYGLLRRGKGLVWDCGKGFHGDGLLLRYPISITLSGPLRTGMGTDGHGLMLDRQEHGMQRFLSHRTFAISCGLVVDFRPIDECVLLLVVNL